MFLIRAEAVHDCPTLMAGLYLHIPYCRHACHYCNFHFSTRLKEIPALIPALLKELHLQREYLSGEGIETLYIGGGTPSVLGTSVLAELMGNTAPVV